MILRSQNELFLYSKNYYKNRLAADEAKTVA
jgi:hypothetical protein